PAPAPAPAPAAPLLTVTAAQLEAELGIHPQESAEVLAVTSESELDDALAGTPRWVSEAFLGLVAGMSFADIRAELGIDLNAAPAGSDDDAAIIAGLHTPAARMEFAWIDAGDTDELRRVIETGDFATWRTWLHPSQQAIVDRNYTHAGRITGGAGTGKTVVAIHRANRLATSGSVLLTTYTRVLAESLRRLITELNPDFPEATHPGAPGLWIDGIDRIISRTLIDAPADLIAHAYHEVLGLTDPLEAPRALDATTQQRWWKEAVDMTGGVTGALAAPQFLAEEYEAVILTQGITTLPAYRRAPRPGRGTPLGRAQRASVWNVIQAFERLCQAERRFPFPVLAALAASVLRAQGPLFDHIIIDEAQDFHAGHWLFLAAAAADGPNNIFIAEDSHQRIYGQRLSLREYGIETRGRSTTPLRLNYRTTRENLAYAVSMLGGTDVNWVDLDGEEDTTHGYRSARSGPLPQVHDFDTEADEFAYVVDTVREWWEAAGGAGAGSGGGVDKRTDADGDDADGGERGDGADGAGRGDIRIGILARTNRTATDLLDRLHEANLPAGTGDQDNSITVLTMHSAKGMEFSNVILVGMSDEHMPLHYITRGLGEHEKNEKLQQERALLYVAASRARDQLVITSSGTRSGLVPAV
ncbi:3'-5' exonuclease, partial [Corynebacterium uberis]